MRAGAGQSAKRCGRGQNPLVSCLIAQEWYEQTVLCNGKLFGALTTHLVEPAWPRREGLAAAVVLNCC